MNNIYEDLNLRLLNVPNAHDRRFFETMFYVHMIAIKFAPKLSVEQKKALYATTEIDVASVEEHEVLISISTIEVTSLSEIVEKMNELKSIIAEKLKKIIDFKGNIELTAILLDPFNQLEHDHDFVDVNLKISAEFFSDFAILKSWVFKGELINDFGVEDSFETTFEPLILDETQRLGDVIQQLATVSWMNAGSNSVSVTVIE